MELVQLEKIIYSLHTINVEALHSYSDIFSFDECLKNFKRILNTIDYRKH